LHLLVNIGIGSVCGLCVRVVHEGSVAEGVMETGGPVKVTLGEMGSVKFPEGSVGSGMDGSVVLSVVMPGIVPTGAEDDASSSCGRGFGVAAAKAA